MKMRNKMSDVLLLTQLIIEYLSNINAAGEYDGQDSRLLYPNMDMDLILELARKVQQLEEMRINNI